MPGASSEDDPAVYDIDPNSLEPGTRVQRLPTRPSKLGGAVPVRFAVETIDKIKAIADEQRVTVSAWIRQQVEQSLLEHQAVTVRSNVVPFPSVLRAQFDGQSRRVRRAVGG